MTTKQSSLKDLNVVFFESRLADTMAQLIRLQGGTPVSAPAMKEVPLAENPTAFLFAEKIFKNEIDVLILLTGVGTRYLVQTLETRFEREKILEAMRRTVIVPRGPKPIKVLNEFKVPYALTVPEPNTWREILSTLDAQKEKIPLKGRLVAVQEYGVTNPELLEGLKARGAEILVVPVYRWALPNNLEPLQDALKQILEEKIQVAIFTTAVQIEHVIKVAGQMNVVDALKKSFQKMAVASVGPDCTEALRLHGIAVDIQPESPKMGPLIAETAKKAKLVIPAKAGISHRLTS